MSHAMLPSQGPHRLCDTLKLSSAMSSDCGSVAVGDKTTPKDEIGVEFVVMRVSKYIGIVQYHSSKC